MLRVNTCKGFLCFPLRVWGSALRPIAPTELRYHKTIKVVNLYAITKTTTYLLTNHWTLCNANGTPSMVLLFHQGINDETNYCEVVNFNVLLTIVSNTYRTHVRRLLKTIILFFGGFLFGFDSFKKQNSSEHKCCSVVEERNLSLLGILNQRRTTEENNKIEMVQFALSSLIRLSYTFIHSSFYIVLHYFFHKTLGLRRDKHMLL